MTAAHPALGTSNDDAEDAKLAAQRVVALRDYKDKVAPFVKTYCSQCHGGNHQKGGVTFDSAVGKPEAASFQDLWKRAAAQIKTSDMPPENAKKQPTDEERAVVLDWIGGMKCLSQRDAGLFVIRKLTRTEYGNTLHDLFEVDPKVAFDLPDEVFGAGYTNSLSPLLMEQYLSVANEVVAKIVAPDGAAATPVQQRWFGDDPADDTDRRLAAEKAARLLARAAYRRPPTDAETQILLRVYDLAAQQGSPYRQRLRLMLKGVLVSPQFLFITPHADGEDQASLRGDVALDDYQLAARLSYLLWSTTPDAELSALADAGKLHNPDVLEAQARRLIADPRSRALFDGFGAQWLGVEKLLSKSFDGGKFPQMDPGLRHSMYDEARLFFESILRENRSLTTFIDSDYTFVDRGLEHIYGVDPNVSNGEMHRATLSNANRGGILTMPGVLAMSSFPNRTSPVNRGVWVLEQVLGEHVPPPPPNVPALEKQEKEKVANLTLRQRMEMHRANPVCANCHKVLDPIGFGLENFDAIGRWRDKDDSGGAIESAGELPDGQHFSSPADLKRLIGARRDDFCQSVASKLLAYALCRQLEGYDQIVVDRLCSKVAAEQYHFQTLVVGVVTSYPFTHRRIDSGEANGR